MEFTFALVCAVIIVGGIVLFVAKVIFPTKWACKHLGWHDGEGEDKHFKEGDTLGVNLSSTCSKCGASVIQDSQGNWF